MLVPKLKETKTEEIVVQVVTCTRCGYRWVADFEFDHWKKNKADGRIRVPATCAHCHSPYYNKLRHNGKANS